MLLVSYPVLFFLSSFSNQGQCQLEQAREKHLPALHSKDDVRQLATLDDRKQFNKQLDNILMPRVVGTENHEKVFNFIVGELKRLKWNVEIDEFEENTPIFGVLKFKNIVAKLNPNAERFLALACHYDSKYFKDQYFEAATDSAVPCAMMLNLAHTMAQTLDQARQSEDVSLELIFFDGEEAFDQWGPTDSIYGAKHLAAQFENAQVLSKTSGQSVSHIQQLDMLVLLDLIGHSGVQFQNFFRSTGRWYKRLVDIEQTLREMNLLKRKSKNYFKKGPGYGAIEDDHVPFLHRNVPILHLISVPFPREWHTPDDSRKIIDMNTVSDLNLMLRVFVSEYLHLLV